MDYAIIKINSKQYIVSQNSTLKIDRVLLETPVEVLGYGNEENFEFGSKKGVVLELVNDLKDKKILVRRYKSKSRYRKEKGHRQPISILKVKSIGDGESKVVALDLAEKKESKKATSTKTKKSVVKESEK